MDQRRAGKKGGPRLDAGRIQKLRQLGLQLQGLQLQDVEDCGSCKAAVGTRTATATEDGADSTKHSSPASGSHCHLRKIEGAAQVEEAESSRL